MRAYFWTNNYLSSIQKGIQAAHCLSEIFMKFPHPGPHSTHSEYPNSIYDWAENHKTIVILSGGNHQDLYTMIDRLHAVEQEQGCPAGFPWAVFEEDHQSLNHAITCFGVVIPEQIYNEAGHGPDENIFSPCENLIIEFLQKSHMAY